MQYNLLKMVQLILASMDSDEVDGIFDTVESRQIVDLIEQTYNDIISQIDFPDLWDLFELTPSNDIDRPTLMYLPDDVAKIEWIQYDVMDDDATAREWKYILPMDREKFFNRMNGLDSAEDDIYQYDYLVGSETFDVRGYNDREPVYYTTVDTRTLIFDNYEVAVSNTLVGNRTKVYGMKIPTFQRLDEWTPELDPRQFTLFFNEAKSLCFAELKQVQNAKAEQRARRGWVHSQRKKMNTSASEIHSTWTPNFGRGRYK